MTQSQSQCGFAGVLRQRPDGAFEYQSDDPNFRDIVLQVADQGALTVGASPPKLRPPDAARYLNIGVSTLAKMRLSGDGPRYAKAGPRVVLYDKADLDAWLESRKRSSTSETPEREDA